MSTKNHFREVKNTLSISMFPERSIFLAKQQQFLTRTLSGKMTGLTFLTGEEKSTAELLMDDCLERSQSVEIDIKGSRAYQALHCVHPSIVKALKQKVLLDLHVS